MDRLSRDYVTLLHSVLERNVSLSIVSARVDRVRKNWPGVGAEGSIVFSVVGLDKTLCPGD